MLLETCKGQDIEDEVYRKKNRMKLNRQEQDYLEKKFVTNPFKWPKAVFKGLAKEMNLPSSKIYKWNWDRRRRCQREKLISTSDIFYQYRFKEAYINHNNDPNWPESQN